VVVQKFMDEAFFTQKPLCLIFYPSDAMRAAPMAPTIWGFSGTRMGTPTAFSSR